MPRRILTAAIFLLVGLMASTLVAWACVWANARYGGGRWSQLDYRTSRTTDGTYGLWCERYPGMRLLNRRLEPWLHPCAPLGSKTLDIRAVLFRAAGSSVATVVPFASDRGPYSLRVLTERPMESAAFPAATGGSAVQNVGRVVCERNGRAIGIVGAGGVALSGLLRTSALICKGVSRSA